MKTATALFASSTVLNRIKIMRSRNAVLALLSPFIAATVHATGGVPSVIGGFGGNPLDGTPITCLSEDKGAVRGTGNTSAACRPLSISPRWEVQLPYRNDTNSATNNYDVWFSITGTPSIPTCCELISVFADGTFFNTPAMCTASSAVLTARSAQLPADGQLYLACRNLKTSANSLQYVMWN